MLVIPLCRFATSPPVGEKMHILLVKFIFLAVFLPLPGGVPEGRGGFNPKTVPLGGVPEGRGGFNPKTAPLGGVPEGRGGSLISIKT